MAFVVNSFPLIHIWSSELDQYWFRYWLVACPAPSQCLNQHSLIVKWTIRNKHKTEQTWNVNRIIQIFIRENAFQNVCGMTAILFRKRWFKCIRSFNHNAVHISVMCKNLVYWYHTYLWCRGCRGCILIVLIRLRFQKAKVFSSWHTTKYQSIEFICSFVYVSEIWPMDHVE